MRLCKLTPWSRFSEVQDSIFWDHLCRPAHTAEVYCFVAASMAHPGLRGCLRHGIWALHRPFQEMSGRKLPFGSFWCFFIMNLLRCRRALTTRHTPKPRFLSRSFSRGGSPTVIVSTRSGPRWQRSCSGFRTRSGAVETLRSTMSRSPLPMARAKWLESSLVRSGAHA